AWANRLRRLFINAFGLANRSRRACSHCIHRRRQPLLSRPMELAWKSGDLSKRTGITRRARDSRSYQAAVGNRTLFLVPGGVGRRADRIFAEKASAWLERPAADDCQSPNRR